MPRSSNSAKFFASKNPASSRTMIGGIIAGPDQAHDAPDHLLHIAAVVAVPLATPENGIDDLAFPNQLQGLESLALLPSTRPPLLGPSPLRTGRERLPSSRSPPPNASFRAALLRQT